MRSMSSYQGGDDVFSGDDFWGGVDTEVDYPVLKRRPNWKLVSILLVYGALLFVRGMVLVD
jgi:hypothetical protein